jgi:uncharacterized Fe-S center protein
MRAFPILFWRRLMASTVYFANLRGRDPARNTVTKIRRLFEEAGFGQIIEQNALVAVKLHFGERGSDAFINPVYVRQVVEKIREHGGKPFLTDSNTLYLGGRSNAVDHIVTAIEHGFDYAVTGAPVVIADGLVGRNAAKVRIGKKRFRAVVVSGDIAALQGARSRRVWRCDKKPCDGLCSPCRETAAALGKACIRRRQMHRVREVH